MKRLKYISQYSKYFILILLFLAAFLERTILDLGPNYELLTTVMILSAYYLGRKQSFLLTFLVIALTDRIIGNSKIFLFTWSGFLIPALFVNSLIDRFKPNLKFLKLTFSGLTANLFFYFWTNFGVWLLDSWRMYTKDLPGLISCYVNALPFLKNQLNSSLVFIPLGVVLIEFVLHISKNFSLGSIFQIRKNTD
jgi:hypothetical protein